MMRKIILFTVGFEDGQGALLRGYQVGLGTGDVVLSEVQNIMNRMDPIEEYVDIPVFEKVYFLLFVFVRNCLYLLPFSCNF